MSLHLPRPVLQVNTGGINCNKLMWIFLTFLVKLSLGSEGAVLCDCHLELKGKSVGDTPYPKERQANSLGMQRTNRIFQTVTDLSYCDTSYIISQIHVHFYLAPSQCSTRFLLYLMVQDSEQWACVLLPCYLLPSLFTVLQIPVPVGSKKNLWI